MVTGHYVDSNWSMKCVTLDFNRLHRQQTGQAEEAFLKAVIELIGN